VIHTCIHTSKNEEIVDENLHVVYRVKSSVSITFAASLAEK